MGLNIVVQGTDIDYRIGPYSYFGSFRVALASLIGIDLEKMEGFGGRRKWLSAPKSSLLHLLNHSDSDGTLSVSQCKKLIPVLLWAKQQFEDAGQSESFGLTCEVFITLCREAIKYKRPLEFC